jgi:hypothetical protein
VTRKTTAVNSVTDLFQDAAPGKLVKRRIGHTSGRGLVETLVEAQADDDEDDAVAAMRANERKTYPVGVLLVVDEFGQMLEDTQWRGDTLTQLLSIYSGNHGGITTGAKKIEGGRCSAALVGSVTMEELSRVLNAGHARSGLLGRFLLSPHTAPKPPLAIPPERGADYAEREAHCLGWLQSLGRWSGDLGNAYDLLTPEARATYETWYADARRAAVARRDEAEESLFARVAATVVKLAVVLAVSEHPKPESMSPANVSILPRHVEAAIEVGEVASARRANCSSGST